MFHIRQTSNNESTIQPTDIEAHTKITDILRTNKQEFFTYTPKSLRPKTLVLKGLSGEFNEEELLSEFVSLDLLNTKIIKISKMKTNTNNEHRIIYIVNLTHDSETSHLRQTNHILYQKIRWEYLKKRTIYQYRKCQRLGHSSVNCNLSFRCVKCGNSHEPGKCETTEKSEKHLLRYANCNNTGHPASYQGCPYIKFINQRTKAERKAPTIHLAEKIKRTIRKGSPGVSYAQATTHTTPAAPESVFAAPNQLPSRQGPSITHDTTP